MVKHGMVYIHAPRGGPRNLFRSLASWVLLALMGGCASGPGVPMAYRVGKNREFATLYPPVSSSQGRVRGPAVVLLHGGFFGDDGPTRAMARELSARGVLAVVPSYRGEKRGLDGARSQGRIDFCGGEVEDTLVLLHRLRERPDVDPERIGLLGASHGGCIALRTAESDPRVKGVVTFSAPTEAAFTYQHLLDHPLGMLGFAGWLGGRLQAWVGGNPQALPRQWAARSPLYGPLPRMPLLLIHGTSDCIVPVDETCWMSDALRRQGRQVTERYFDHGGRDVPPYPVCGRQGGPPGIAGVVAAPQEAGGGAVEVHYYAEHDHVFGKKAWAQAKHRALDYLVVELYR